MKKYFDNMLDKLTKSYVDKTPMSADDFTVESLKHYPKCLYRYRSCTDYNFDAIRNDYLWASAPSDFYDPCDSVVNLKLKSELSDVHRFMNLHMAEFIYNSIPPKGMKARKKGLKLEDFIKFQNEFVSADGVYDGVKLKNYLTAQLNGLGERDKYIISGMLDFPNKPEFKNRFESHFNELLFDIINTLRYTTYICCLTERNDNRKMWEEYGDKYQGFVAEYETSLIMYHPKLAGSFMHLFPVSYYKRMPRVPTLPFLEYAFYKEIYGREIDVFDANKKLYKQLFVKHYDYHSEEEWRIVSNSNIIHFPILSAIYAGFLVSDENLEILKDICREKNIPLYKQHLNNTGNKFYFDKIL